MNYIDTYKLFESKKDVKHIFSIITPRFTPAKDLSKLVLEQSTATGDCYEANFNEFFYDGFYNFNNTKLVHGIVINQRDGLPMGHCWVETDNGKTVIDKSNGRNIKMSAKAYYGIGQIQTTFKYTMDEARRKILDSGHYGYWDLELDEGR